MISLLQTIFVIGTLLTDLSSSSVIPRHYSRPALSQGHDGGYSGNPASTDISVPITAANLPIISNLDSPPVPNSGDSEDSEDPEDSCDASDDSKDGSETEPVNDETTLSTPEPTGTAQSDTYIQYPNVAAPAPAPVIPTTTPQPDIATQPPSAIPTYPAVPAAPAAGEFWEPPVGATWQIELSGVVSDTSYPADVFDVDLFDTPQATIDSLHAAGKKVICYFSAGSFEDWRPDQDDFQAADKGTAMEGWDGEWWLNTNTANVRSIMAARIDLAATKKCDAVDPDNIDGYQNENGVGLTAADATDFLNFLADTAHDKGLAIGLKNAGDIVGEVVDKMQFHVNEQCIEYDECHLFKPFIDAGKPVFHIEYLEAAPTLSRLTAEVKSDKCVAATTHDFSTVLKTLSLDAWVDPC